MDTKKQIKPVKCHFCHKLISPDEDGDVDYITVSFSGPLKNSEKYVLCRRCYDLIRNILDKKRDNRMKKEHKNDIN